MNFFNSRPADWYARSLIYHHPPFFYLLLRNPIDLRFGDLAANDLDPYGHPFPWVIWKWLVRQHLPHGALAALLILEFSPNLISLNAQVRGYMLLLLLVSLAMFF